MLCPLVFLILTFFTNDVTCHFDIILSESVAARVIRGDKTMLYFESLGHLVHDLADELSTIVRLKESRKADEREDVVKSGHDCDGLFVRNWPQEHKSSKNIYKHE